MSALQQEVAELWMGMALQQSCGPGTLSLCRHDGDNSLAFTLACIGSGGAVLLLANGKAEAKQGSQSGAIDFIVDTLSEALRILKNELRQRRSVAVALVGDVEANIAAMEERGVQPQFVEVLADGTRQWLVFVQRGAVPIVTADLRQHALATAALEHLSSNVHAAADFAGRRAGDERLGREFSETESDAESSDADRAAQQWIRIAPRLFPRDRDRVYWHNSHKRSAP